jgi:hypothetical protein
MLLTVAVACAGSSWAECPSTVKQLAWGLMCCNGLLDPEYSTVACETWVGLPGQFCDCCCMLTASLLHAARAAAW